MLLGVVELDEDSTALFPPSKPCDWNAGVGREGRRIWIRAGHAPRHFGVHELVKQVGVCLDAHLEGRTKRCNKARRQTLATFLPLVTFPLYAERERETSRLKENIAATIF